MRIRNPVTKTEKNESLPGEFLLPEVSCLVDGDLALGLAGEARDDEEPAVQRPQDPRTLLSGHITALPKPKSEVENNVVDPDPSDTYVFGPPGSESGSVSQRYRSGSDSFYHEAKKVSKTLIPTVL